jgi:hypothetical protein
MSILNSRALWLMPLLFVIIIMIHLTLGPCQDTRAERFEEFFSHDVSGRIIDIGSSSGFAYLRVRDTTYEFLPHFSGSDRKWFFREIAAVGDSIYKPAYSDTLYLYKQGSTYWFTFAKFTKNEGVRGE